MMKRLKKPPDWFRLEDYRPTRTFDIVDWAYMLFVRLEGEARLFERLYGRPTGAQPSTRGLPAHILKPLWQAHLQEVLPVNYERRRCQGFDPIPYIDWAEKIEEVTEALLGSSAEREKLAKSVDLMQRRVLTINPMAPDEVLLEEFRRWLSKENVATRVKRPGPSSKGTTQFTDTHTARWCRYGVLAIRDLDTWAELAGEPPLTHECLADLLEAGADDAKRWGSKARKMARELLDITEPLAAQATTGGRK